MKVEELLKKYIKSEKKRKAFMKEAVRKNLVFEECSGPLMFDKKYLNNRHCTMCGKTLDFWDFYRDFSINTYIGYGSAYDLTRFSATLCCHCFDKVMDTIMPLFKYEFPLTPCLFGKPKKEDREKFIEKEMAGIKAMVAERIKKNQEQIVKELLIESKKGH